MPAQIEDAVPLVQDTYRASMGRPASPRPLNGTLPARAHFIALNTEVILPWSEPAKNWDRRHDRYKPAVRMNGRYQG